MKMEENMDNQKKLSLLEDLFEMEEGTLKPETALADIEEWDSITKLSLIVMVDDECGKTLNNDDFKKFNTIQDIMDYMG